MNDFSNLVGLENVEEQENERYRNVLNRKKQNNDVYDGGNKRAREGGDEEDNFNGLFDGKSKKKGKFSAKRSKSNRKSKRS